MLEQPKLAAHVEEEDAPLGVVGGSKVQRDGDVRLHVDGGKGADRGLTHDWSSRRRGGAGDLGGHQQIESVEGEGGRSPREGGARVVWEEASPAREGATPGGGCAWVEADSDATVDVGTAKTSRAI